MALLLTPLRWVISSILRVAIFAGALVVLWFLLLGPTIEGGEQKVARRLDSLEKSANPKRLAHCIEHADGDVEKMRRCSRVSTSSFARRIRARARTSGWASMRRWPSGRSI